MGYCGLQTNSSLPSSVISIIKHNHVFLTKDKMSVRDTAQLIKKRCYLTTAVLPVHRHLKLKKKLYGPFLWIGFNCLEATEPL